MKVEIREKGSRGIYLYYDLQAPNGNIITYGHLQAARDIHMLPNSPWVYLHDGPVHTDAELIAWVLRGDLPARTISGWRRLQQLAKETK